MRRAVVLLVVTLSCGVVLILLSLPRGPGAASRPSDWLRLVSGPVLSNHTNAQGVVIAVVTLTLSNAGPSQLMFRFEDLRWTSGNSQESANTLLGLMHLASGTTTNIAMPTTGVVPPQAAAYVMSWNLPWWEERTGMRHFLTWLQQRFPFALWRTPPLRSGKLDPPRHKGDEEDYFRLKYGLVRRTLEPKAEPFGAENGTQPAGSDSNRIPSAVGSRR